MFEVQRIINWCHSLIVFLDCRMKGNESPIMYMYVYICICMYMYVYICICMYMYVYMYM